MNIGGIVLAAGCSRRMGKSKVIMPVQGKPMFLHSVELAKQSKLAPICVVTGKYAEHVNNYATEQHIQTVHNEDYRLGMSTSIKVGIQTIEDTCDAVVIFLGDHPFTPLLVVEDMVQAYKEGNDSGTKIVRPKYKGNPGHPILFDSTLFRELKEIKGDIGGRTVIQNNIDSLQLLPYDNRKWGTDIDTMEEYNRWK